jgi:hypothetical protein
MKKVAFCVLLVLASCAFALGQTYKVLYSFGATDSGDGAIPGGLVSDHLGNLYGPTGAGGNFEPACTNGGCGTIFELSPNPDGTWTESVIYRFCSNGSGGSCPDGGAPGFLAIDDVGNLYGTTGFGPSSSPCAYPQITVTCGGTIFELSPPQSGGGPWIYALLYKFCSVMQDSVCLDGSLPTGLLLDKSGNLFGTTLYGGSGAGGQGIGTNGVVFQLSLATGGWTESVLYSFCPVGQGSSKYCPDGSLPSAGVSFNKAQNIYGTTLLGGVQNAEGAGTVFKLSPNSGGWSESVAFPFSPQGRLGRLPAGKLPLTPTATSTPQLPWVERIITGLF